MRTYYISCDPDSFAYIHEPEQVHEDIYISCELVYNGQVWHDARLRIRGDSSRNYPKKSYKVNFDADERFYGRDKLNLTSEWRDASYSREYLSYDFFHRSGLPASRTWFCRVYINGEYMGLYLDVEQIDEQYLAGSHLPNDASIYKASYDGSMLRMHEPIEEVWEKKTNETTGFYDLADLIEWIDTVPEERFFEEMDVVFNRDQFARHMAVNTIIGNSSTYYHNYYLIHDLSPQGLWTVLPWDIDRSFNFWGDYSMYPQYYLNSHPYMEDTNPLVVRCWRNDEMRNLIFEHTRNMIDSLVTEEYYTAIVVELDSLLRDAVEEDEYCQYTIEEVRGSIAGLAGEILDRGVYMSEAISQEPLPFDISPVQFTREGVRFSWDRAVIASGENTSYDLYIDTAYNIPDPVVYSVGQDTTFLLPDLTPGDYFWKVVAYSPSGRFTTCLRWYRSFTIPENFPEGTVVTGVLNEDTVWTTENNPIWIADSLVIPENITLQVEEGAHIIFLENASLVNYGSVSLSGTLEDSIVVEFAPQSSEVVPIRMTGYDASLYALYTDFRGDIPDDGVFLAIEDNATAEFVYSQLLLDNGTVVDIGDSRISMHECTVAGSFHGFITAGDDSQIAFHEGSIRTQSDDADCFIVQSTGDSLIASFAQSSVHLQNGYMINQHGNAGLIYISGVQSNGGALANGLRVSGHNNTIEVENSVFLLYDTAVYLQGEKTILEIYNSVFFRNRIACTVTEESGRIAQPYIRNSIFYGNETDLYQTDHGSMDLGFNYFDTDAGSVYPGTVTGDLLVIDAWNGNWEPMWHSPLIDAGCGYGAPEFDIVGQPRVDVLDMPNAGTGVVRYVDIGIYEYKYGVQHGPLPDEPGWVHVYPNPTTGHVNIFYDLENGDSIHLRIYDILGRQVYATHREGLLNGPNTIRWEGNSSSGTAVASGVYFLQLEQGSKLSTRRIVIVR